MLCSTGGSLVLLDLYRQDCHVAFGSLLNLDWGLLLLLLCLCSGAPAQSSFRCRREERSHWVMVVQVEKMLKPCRVLP